jgi:hypothetical protein
VHCAVQIQLRQATVKGQHLIFLFEEQLLCDKQRNVSQSVNATNVTPNEGRQRQTDSYINRLETERNQQLHYKRLRRDNKRDMQLEQSC